MSLAERAVVDMSENAKYSQTKLLAVMNVPSSTFYSHKAPKSPTEHDLQDALIIEKIQEIVDAHEFNNSYGIERMVQELADQYDIHTGEHRVHRLMQKIEYKSVITQSYKGNRGRPVVERDNLVKDIIIERPYQVLTTDVTYLVMPDKQKLYKASVLDWFTGDVIGAVVGYDMTSDLTKRALQTAMRQIPKSILNAETSIILHSDNGSHFISEEYEDTVSFYGLMHSFSSPGHPEHNTIIENYHSFFKSEFFNPRRLSWSINAIIAGAHRYDYWWNTTRISTKTRPAAIPLAA